MLCYQVYLRGEGCPGAEALFVGGSAGYDMPETSEGHLLVL